METTLICPNCDSDVPPENQNVDRFVAICPTCDTIFDFTQTGEVIAPGAEPSTSSGISAKKKRDGLPRRARPSDRVQANLSTTGKQLHITLKKRGKGLIGLTVFTLIWDGFMLFWFGIAFGMEEFAMAAFGSIHATIGLVLLYVVLRGWLNTTEITVTPKAVEVITGPIPVHMPRQYGAGEIDGIYIRQKTNSSLSTYDVMILHAQSDDKLVTGGIGNYQDAAFIELEIEKFFGMPDERAPYEVQRQSYY